MSDRTNLANFVFYIALLSTIVGAHFIRFHPTPEPPRIRDVLEINPRLMRIYDDTLDPDEPDLMIIGDCHLMHFGSPGRNQLRIQHRGGDMVLNELAHQIEREHPVDHRRTFARFAAPSFRPVEQLGATGLLLHRSEVVPKVVVIATRWELFSMPVPPKDLAGVPRMLKYPEAAQALVDELSRPPVRAAQEVIDAVRAMATPTEPPPIDATTLDAALGEWFADRLLLERNIVHQWLLTYFLQIPEASILEWFGPVEQLDLRSAIPLVTDPELRDLHLESFSALLRLLRARDIEIFCYLSPRDPSVESSMPDNPAWGLEITKSLEQRAAAEQCPLVDLTDSVPAGDDNWGWWGGYRDPVHLMPDGVIRFGRTIFEAGEAHGAWEELDHP